jgi:replication factor C subunit 3/5
LREIHPYVLRLDVGAQEIIMIDLLDQMACLEVNLSGGSSERLQLGALVGAFQIARNKLAALPIQ